MAFGPRSKTGLENTNGRIASMSKVTQRTVVVALTLLFGAAWIAMAQVSTAVLVGSVADPSGAAIPGAELTLTSTRSGTSLSTVSGSDGGYVFPQIPVGEYALKVTLTGFRQFEQTGIVL